MTTHSCLEVASATDVRSGAAVVLLHQLRQPRCETVQHLVTNNALTVLLEVCQYVRHDPCIVTHTCEGLTPRLAIAAVCVLYTTRGMLQSPAMRAFAAKILTRLIADNPPAARQLLKLRNSLSIILRLVNNIDADLLIATEGVALVRVCGLVLVRLCAQVLTSLTHTQTLLDVPCSS